MTKLKKTEMAAICGGGRVKAYAAYTGPAIAAVTVGAIAGSFAGPAGTVLGGFAGGVVGTFWMAGNYAIDKATGGSRWRR